NLQAFGDVEASALNGRGGNWLLDPFDISIVSGSTDTNADEGNNNNGIFTPNGDGSSVGADNIETRLNSGTNVTIKTASSTSGANKWGNITVNADINHTAANNVSLSLEADGNINITNHNITSTAGKLDVNLLGGGSHTGMISLNNANITTNGGDITLGQLNHTESSTTALTVKVANSTLNASTTSGNGSITISAFNPNVSLSVPDFNTTVRNGGSLLEVNHSTLTGGDISLTGTQSGVNGKSLPVYLNNATLEAGGDISILGNNSADSAAAQLELRYKNTLTAGGNITVSSTKAGVFLNGNSATNNISLSAGGNITVQGQNETAGTFKDGVNISNATLTSSAGNVTVTGIGSPAGIPSGIGVNISSGSIEARKGNVTLSGEGTGEKGVALVNEKVTAGDITVTGSTRDWAGVLLTNSSLNASGSLSLKGDATGYWKGFSTQPQGVKIQQGSSLVAAGDLTVTGSAKNNGQGLILDSSTVNSSGVGDIVLTGTAGNNAQGGANVTSTTISAASGNVTLNGSVSVVSGGATGMYLSGVGITATAGDIAVNGVGYDSGQGALRLTGNNNFSAQNTVLSGEAGRNNIGTLLSGNLNVTAGNLSVAGMTHHYNNDAKNIYRGLKADGLVLDVSNGDLTLSGQALAYDGVGPQTGGTVGLDLKNSTLKASHAAVNGSSVFSGSGFVLDNVTLSGGIEHGNNMTFSSNGSAANVTNLLSVNGGLGYDVFLEMQKSGIDNDTSVFINVDADVLQQMRFNATSGWTYDASDITKSASDKAGTWGLWFTGIDACTTGSISLTGVNLTNSNLTGSSLTLRGADDVPLAVQDTDLNATSGDISLSADVTNGNALVLSGNNITATGNITLSGHSVTRNGVTLNSTNLTGDFVTVTGTSDNKAGTGLDIADSNLNATAGNLSLTGRMNGAGGGFGTHIHGSNTFTAAENIAVNGSAMDGTKGGLNVNGGTFSAKNTELNGQSDQNNIGVKVGSTITVTQGNLSITGTANRTNSSPGVTGLMSDGTLNIDVQDGSLNLTGTVNDAGSDASRANTATGLKLSTTTLNAKSANLTGVSAYAGQGFSLNDVNLSGGIEHGNNMTFSSNGSAANVTNLLSVNGGLGYDVFLEMQKSGIDNVTSVFINVDADVLQQMRFNATSGWTYDASDITKSASDKAGTWGLWFTGIDACTTGSISLTGVNLTNSNLTGSSLTLRGADDAPLTVQDTDLNATSGDISLNSGGSIELAGGNVSGQNVSVSSVGGDINSTANITKNDGGDGTLNLSAAGNITFNSKVSVTNVSEKLDVNLLGAGTQSGKISLTGANIVTNGGNITLGQLNHSDDSATALTVKVGGKSVLNASGASGNGTIHISAFNPDVDLNVPEFTNTVRNGGAILEVNNSNLVGGDISLTGTQSGEYGKGIPVYLNTATLTASGNISLLENNSADSATAWLELGDKNTLTAGGNITVNSTGAGVWLNASSAAKATSLNAADTITVQGKNAGLRTEMQDGVKIMHAVLNASHASLAGATDGDGQGFSLNNVTLSGGIEKGNNLILSSEGSDANVTNTLNVKGGIGYSAFEMLQHAGIDNNTSVLVNVEATDLTSMGLTDATSDWTYDARDAGKPDNSKAGRWGVAFTGINASTSGNISLIGVNLTNSNLTGGNLTLQGLGDSPLTVQNTNLTASSGNASLISEGTISLSGGNVQALQGSVNVQAGGVNGTAGGNALSVSNVNFSSQNGTTLSGLSADNGVGVKLTGNINVTQGDLTVNGTTTRVNNATGVRGIDARGANINVSGTNAVLNMTGAVKGDADAEQTQSVVGLDLGAIKNGKNWVIPRINATSASLTGTSTAKGMGFILNASLSDSLKSTDSNNLNLSSLGSDDAAYNYIGDQVDDDFVHHMIEAGTSIGSKTEVQKVNIYKAELQDWLDDSHRNSFDLNKDFGEWILSFSGLHLNTAGDINITGASFSDSQLWAGGNLTLDNGPGNLSLSGSTLKSRSGYMNLTGGNGINLTNGNISAENDITLNADHGYVKISGSSASNRANVSSVNGSILLHGNKNIEVGRGMDFYNVSIHAQKDIDISADGNWSGVRMTNTSISSESGGIDINASARKAGYDYANAENAALILTNDIVFDSRTGTNINVSNTNVIKSYSPSVALAFEVENMLIKGGGNINASSSYGAVVLSPLPGHMIKDSKSTLTVQEGDLIINALLDERAKGGPNGADGSSAAGALVFNNGYNPIEFNIKTNKGNVIINADSSANKNAPFNAFAAATPQSTANMGMFNGFRFSGDSNVSITAIADQADAINLRLFDNTELTGHLSITGKSTSGTGVIFDRRLKTKVINATITGSSFSGDGTKLIAQRGSADLNGNIMTGISDTATGVSISGSNVSITNGTVSGTSGGNGDGVQLIGGTNYTIDGATVTGQSQSGNGIGVGGNLSVSNATLKGDTVTGSGVNISGRLNTINTAITGNATGNGTGVFVSGTLIAESGENNSLTGNSAQGNGVFISETAVLTNIVVSGGSVSGTGVVQDENAILTNVTLHGMDGSGSDLGTGGNVNDSGSVLPGESDISDGGIFNGVPTNDSLNVPPFTGTGSHVTDYNWQNVVKQRQHLWLLQAAREQDERSQRQLIPASGYREPEKPVVVDICTDGEVSCRHLDAGMRNRPSHP
ncbi:TPA: hypothetical protein R4E55_004641, partial [Salmonella enterica subsp. enterica serovar Poona]|nr:hypothetical protein [Salmonella enterica subsp. enterica serovar Poona]